MNESKSRIPLIAAEGLTKVFGDHRRSSASGIPAVDDVSIQIRAGETLGLVGETGSGKSTLGLMLIGLEQPTSGQVRFDGQDLSALSPKRLQRLRREMQIVFQDPIASLNRHKTVGAIIGLPMVIHREGYPGERRERMERLLELVGLRPNHADCYRDELSGGQCQRVAIARAIALNPRFLVLDEAVSALDVSIQAQVLNLLRDLQRRLGLTYLFISHDLSTVRYMSDRIAVMKSGQIVEVADRADLFANPTAAYTLELLEAVPQLPSQGPYPGGALLSD